MIVYVTGQPNPTFQALNSDKMTQIYVKVRPNSNEFKIENGSMPEIYLESEAENGKANAELLNRLEEILGEKPGIVSGHKSSRKKLEIPLPKQKIEEKLEAK